MTKSEANKFMNEQLEDFVDRARNAQTDEEKMKFVDRTLCNMLQKAVAKQNSEEYEPWQKALMGAVGQKCDWTNKSYLEPLLKYIQEL